jgi:predicted Fe-Mo cluster-binding NifX family protein
MIVFISAKQQRLDSPVDERFGRAEWFIKVDSVTKQWEAFANPGCSKPGGAGVAAAQFLIDQKASAIISGFYGPNAVDALRGANINMYLFSNSNATVQQALDDFLQGELALMGSTNQQG